MASFTLRPVDRGEEADLKRWNGLIAKADGATIFHKPDFLAYHASRFDELHLGCFRGGELYGVMPMAMSEEAGVRTARSPYGGSVGGFVFADTPGYFKCDELLTELTAFLKGRGVARLVLTPPVTAYYAAPSDSLAFAMLRHGFTVANSELTSIVALGPSLETEVFTSRARNMARKAEKLGVRCAFRAPLDDFWKVMDLTFGKHGVPPTHSREEWAWLMDRLPESVWVDVAYLEGVPVAGIGHFRINGRADSSFYLASDPEARDAQGLSLLVYRSILNAAEQGYAWFDFGGSSVNMVPRENVIRFKESFGALGMFRHSYALDLA
jgi:hypothetical protein